MGWFAKSNLKDKCFCFRENVFCECRNGFGNKLNRFFIEMYFNYQSIQKICYDIYFRKNVYMSRSVLKESFDFNINNNYSQTIYIGHQEDDKIRTVP